jgi:hypothetical protein
VRMLSAPSSACKLLMANSTLSGQMVDGLSTTPPVIAAAASPAAAVPPTCLTGQSIP